MSTKTRDTSRKRESIVDAATRAFQEEGYDNTSMDRIAEVAGASKRTVYNHFSSKGVLFEAVIDRFLSEAAALKQVPYDPDRGLEEQLGDFADAKLKMLSDPAWLGLFKVGLGAFVRDPELARKAAARAERGGDALAAWLRAATADGRLDVENPDLAAQVFWAMVSGGLFWPQALEGSMDEGRAETLKDELIRTFLARHGV